MSIDRAARALLLLSLGTQVLVCAGQTRLSERRLADIAHIGVPVNLQNEQKPGLLPDPRAVVGQQTHGQREELRQRLSFGFSSTDLWASLGSARPTGKD